MEDLNFDEMRKQIAILKEKLDKQEIVNDKMMHKTISTMADRMKSKMMAAIACGAFVVIVAPLSFHEVMGASWYFVFATDIMMMYCMIREYLFKKQISDNALMNASLFEVAKTMQKFKKGYKKYTFTNMVIILPLWIVWLSIEKLVADSAISFTSNTGDTSILCNNITSLFSFDLHADTYYYLIAMFIGASIGSIIGLRMYFQIQDTASDIIKQIED